MKRKKAPPAGASGASHREGAHNPARAGSSSGYGSLVASITSAI